MTNALVTHAKQKVWCATNQDFQHHIYLSRLTPERGVVSKYPVLWDELQVPLTPTRRDYFHFYQVGNLPTGKFDFIIEENKWINYLDLNKANNILIDVYLISGGIVPRDYIWITRLYNNNIVVAIKNDLKIDYGICNKTYFNGAVYDESFMLDNSGCIIRFYSNAYFESVGFVNTAINPKQPLQFNYARINSQADYNTFMSRCVVIENQFGSHGLGVYYIDGFVISKPTTFKPEFLGKYFGFMWDESFKFEQLFDIKFLPAFISEKNRGVRKYLLVPNKEYRAIDYYDDIDIYIVNKLTGKGVYYNMFGRFGINMITHNSYAINADAVENYIQAHKFLGSIDDCAIKIMVRHGGRKNELLNQKSRLRELYQLPYDEIISAHINTPSLVPQWTAPQLEQSAYVNLMSASSSKINEALVVDAYGYNSLCRLFANPLLEVVDNEFIAPEITRITDKKTGVGSRSVFCYNSKGLLVGDYYTTSSSPIGSLPAGLTDIKTVECFNGIASDEEVQAWINDDVSDYDLDQYGFRCYVSPGDINGITNQWQDVTGSKYYTYTKSKPGKPATIKWNWALLSQADLYPAVKTNKTIFLYRWNKPATVEYDGCLEFEVKAIHTWSRVKQKKTLSLPPGNVDVFANGLSLIENVDYFLEWPKVVIINRDVNRSKVIDVIIRCYGFGDPRTGKPFKSAETGFVKGGMLSINDVYDVREDKCLRVVVDNKLVNIADMNFGEYQRGNYYTDGKPYSVSDYVLPLENLLPDHDSWSLYQETLSIDKIVSNYLTPRLPEKEAINVKVEVTRWPVISPVVSSILHAYTRNYNFDSLVPDNYSNEDIEKWFRPFKWLLDFDPAYRQVDENYFRIEPHANATVMTVSQKQYEFLEWINSLYLNNRIDLSMNVKIG